MSKNELKNIDTVLGFAGLGIKDSILKVIADLGLITPTPIQHQAIPAALNGDDIVGIAQTGTGKTFAFGIPMLQRLALLKGRGLVLLPTRELAGQVETSLRSLGVPLGLRTASLIGGEAIGRQLFALRKRPHIIVATPGRLIDHLKRQSVSLADVSVLVLDEADMMFDMGFAPQIEEVLQRVPANRQTLLFSATMPAAVMKLAEKHLRTPVRVEVAPAGTTAELVEQEMYILPRDDRWNQLLHLLSIYKESVLIFVRTKHGASKLAKKLQGEKFKAAEIHSNLSFPQRQAALAGFRSGQHRILVATDVAARGLDINDIELVLNFDLPDNSEDYVHRIGRTARAGKKGKAISFVAPDQRREIQKIERLIRQSVPVKQLGAAPVGSRARGPKPFISSPAARPVKRFNHHRQAAVVKREMAPVKNSNSSLGFSRRSENVDLTALPDYLQPTRKTPVRPLSNRDNKLPLRSGRRFSAHDYANKKEQSMSSGARPADRAFISEVKTPPIVNPGFDGGNRFAFRRTMYRLREEAKGVRPTAFRNKVETVKKTAPAVEGNFRQRQVGVRASGFKVFKSETTKSPVRNVSGSTDDSSSARPAFKAKSFRPRFKRK